MPITVRISEDGLESPRFVDIITPSMDPPGYEDFADPPSVVVPVCFDGDELGGEIYRFRREDLTPNGNHLTLDESMFVVSNREAPLIAGQSYPTEITNREGHVVSLIFSHLIPDNN